MDRIRWCKMSRARTAGWTQQPHEKTHERTNRNPLTQGVEGHQNHLRHLPCPALKALSALAQGHSAPPAHPPHLGRRPLSSPAEHPWWTWCSFWSWPSSPWSWSSFWRPARKGRRHPVGRKAGSWCPDSTPRRSSPPARAPVGRRTIGSRRSPCQVGGRLLSSSARRARRPCS